LLFASAHKIKSKEGATRRLSRSSFHLIRFLKVNTFRPASQLDPVGRELVTFGHVIVCMQMSGELLIEFYLIVIDLEYFEGCSRVDFWTLYNFSYESVAIG
jgi:hypothetical protein